MRVVTLANHKGGVAKTTTAYTLGAGLRRKNKKVLLVDLDPQTNLSFIAGVDVKESDYRLYNVFKGEIDINDCIYQIEDDLEDFDILVGGKGLINADNEFISKKNDYLKKALSKIKSDYDFVIVDCPPSLGTLTKNAIVASNDIIIPLRPDVFSLQGLGSIQGILEDKDIIKNNPCLNVAGLLLVGVNERTNLSKVLIDRFNTESKKLNSKVFKTIIHNGVAIQESQLNQISIFDHAPKSKVATDYQDFVNEYLKGVKKCQN